MKHEEEWKPIKGYEGLYEVSCLGRVRSFPRNMCMRHPRNPKYKLEFVKQGRILKPKNQNEGYSRVSLCKDNIIHTALVHRLVADAFIPNPKKLPLVNHKDENKKNNHVENLEWVTARENLMYNGAAKKRARCHWHPVIQMTLDGNFIKRWDYIRQAATFYGIRESAIYSVCVGKTKTAKGFRWRYANE